VTSRAKARASSPDNRNGSRSKNRSRSRSRCGIRSRISEEDDNKKSVTMPILSSEMDKLLTLTSLQTAAGAFRYEKTVVDLVIGAELEKFRELCDGRNIAQDRWLTAFIIAFIEQRFAAEKDTWELIVDKSREWLRDDPLVEEAKKMIH